MILSVWLYWHILIINDLYLCKQMNKMFILKDNFIFFQPGSYFPSIFHHFHLLVLIGGDLISSVGEHWWSHLTSHLMLRVWTVQRTVLKQRWMGRFTVYKINRCSHQHSQPSSPQRWRKWNGSTVGGSYWLKGANVMYVPNVSRYVCGKCSFQC